MFRKYLILSLLIFTSCTIRRDFTPKPFESNERNLDSISNISLFEDGSLIIIRDDWGVPHIFGKKDSDTAFGLAYAHSQDDFQTMHDLLLRARGEYASIYGPGKNKIDASLDYLVGLLKVWETVENQYEIELSEETRLLCEGYANGINYYIEKNPDVEQYIYPVKPQDIVAGFIYKTPFFFDLPIFLSVLYTREPNQIPRSFTIDDKINLITKGSNVFAVSPKLTSDESTLLAINSHQPWNGDLAWYEAHIYSDEGLNISGGLFPGSPIILVGYNEHLGWGHTVNSPDILDIYELTINPEDENQYFFDGEWLDLEEYDVNIAIKGVGKLGISHSEPAFWSIHGPVIKGEHATYAIRYSWENNIKIIEQWYRMNKATSFEEFNNAMSLMALPMFNTGYADKEGNIFYLYNAKLPIRDSAYNWQGVVPGNTSSTLWKDFAKYQDLPQTFNPSSGYIQNCNNAPYYTLNKDLKENATLYSGFETHNTNRSIRSEEFFSTANSITYEDFKTIKFDLKYSNNSTIAQIINRAITLTQNEKNPKIKKAVKILDNWDLSTDVNNSSAALPIISFGKFIDTPIENITDQMILDNLNTGIDFLYKYHQGMDIPWGNINKLIRGDVILPLSGGPDILRAIYGIKTEDGLLKGVAGDAYMALVQWDKNGTIKSETIHQFGSATIDEKSEHYSDQAYLFSEGKLKQTSLDINRIIKNAKSIQIIY